MATHPVGSDASPYDDLAALPDGVRGRVLALTAEVLPLVAGLPPAVRRVAGFAPNRRARLGGSAIGEALLDDDLRERVAVQVAALATKDDDRVEVAARAWLSREDGWSDLVGQAGSTAEDVRGGRDAAELARVRDRLEAAEQAAREARAKSKAQLEEYKTENATLRRKLGESRTAERQARETAEEALRLAEEARARTAALEAGQDKELRRLRARVEQLEAEQAAQRREERRTSRADRDEATVRARLLLDSVIEAAAGLRRELALPAVSGAPGDRVEAELAESGDDRAPTTVSVLTSGSLLEQVLSMPRSRLLIDGYNVSKSAWAQSSLEAQRQRLLRSIAPLVSRTGAETTVVFDAANLTSRPVVAAPRGVKVVFSPPGVIADDVLRDLVAAEPPGRAVVVVTDDQAVVRDARAAGSRVASAAALIELLDRG
ncbi:NYN domain-containing protein [Nocardioides agariphilus]|jgi:predicted RNA-binding protein with PIN domain|uniref:NYN domain-containing protein n=1 Tax=Nocardioides agariphilus TaxID=433664 RepID=A0A930VNR5_9ACTN|nr:NYN domain-containing protein [Nocardioides agariphilus]MBF4769006.1 NYN domain-containing protein [Nocardioides agariphilus]